MMPVVRISDATFDDLSALKRWLGTKTPGETIDRVVREAMEELGIERDDEPEEVTTKSSSGAMEFDRTPGLTFTKPTSATVNGRPVQTPRWRSILAETVSAVKSKGLTAQKLVEELNIPARIGIYEDEGFTHHPELGVSIQGQSAADAWREIDRLASKWKIPVSVEFFWRQNPKAQYPGKTGILRSGH